MEDLFNYVKNFTSLGNCYCTACQLNQKLKQEEFLSKEIFKHTTNLIFFEVVTKEGAHQNTLRELIEHTQRLMHQPTEDDIPENYLDLFDGREHNYYELLPWFGSNEMSLRFMALCYRTGLFQLITPEYIFTEIHGVTPAMKLNLATLGFISIVLKQ